MRYFYYTTLWLLIVMGCKQRPANLPENATADTANTNIAAASASSEVVLVIDVRSQEEYSAEHIKDAINIPYTIIAQEIGKYAKDKTQKILLYCLSGSRSGTALKTLNDLGYTNVENIGGYNQAKARLE